MIAHLRDRAVADSFGAETTPQGQNHEKRPRVREWFDAFPIAEVGQPGAGIASLPGQDLLGQRVHASRGLAGPHGAENGHSGVESPLRDNEPGMVADFDGFDRVVNLSDNAAGPGVSVGRKGLLGSNLRVVRMRPQNLNRTRQTVMRNSPPIRTAAAGTA